MKKTIAFILILFFFASCKKEDSCKYVNFNYYTHWHYKTDISVKVNGVLLSFYTISKEDTFGTVKLKVGEANVIRVDMYYDKPTNPYTYIDTLEVKECKDITVK